MHDHFLKLVNFHCLNKYFNANQISGIFKRFVVFYAGEGENFLQKEKASNKNLIENFTSYYVIL